MRKILALLILITVLFAAAYATARGGRTDDCPAGSTDPDCTGTPSTPPAPAP